MNCQEFETILNDLARAKPIDVALRERGLSHTETCGNCAVRLTDEHSLTLGLKAVAVITEESSVSPQVEAALLKAFRQRTAKSNVVELPARRKQTRVWALAAAAILVALFSLAVSQFLKGSSPKQKEVVLTPSPSVSPITNPLLSKPKEQNQKEQNQLAGSAFESKEAPPPKFHGKRLQQQTSSDGSYVLASVGEFTPVLSTQEPGQEVVTDFLPLFHGADPQPLESGQLIRVQMPRSALASFGLPINQERTNVPVKADVLLAEDGSARAIRFVR